MAVRSCGFVIFRRLRGTVEYLLLQSSNETHDWSPPKGHVEAGENDMQTAFRESEEEAGLIKDDLKVYEHAKHQLIYNAWGKSKIVIYWLAELITDKEVQLSDEHQDFKWLTFADACKYANYENMKETLEIFDKHISH